MRDACKLLVLDDEPDIVEELTEFLESEGFDCVGRTSAAMALEAIVSDPSIGVLLLDLRMPDQDGLSFIRQLRGILKPGRPIEVMIFTGHGGEDELIQALRLGVGDYMRKPVDLDELVRIVDRLIQQYTEQKRRLALGSGVQSRLDELAQAIDSMNQRVEALRGDMGLPAAAVGSTGNGGARVGRGIPPELKLTRRQQDVLELIAKGFNNYQIACDLGISENTVKLHVSQILRATGLYNRTQLALAYEKWQG